VRWQVGILKISSWQGTEGDTPIAVGSTRKVQQRVKDFTTSVLQDRVCRLVAEQLQSCQFSMRSTSQRPATSHRERTGMSGLFCSVGTIDGIGACPTQARTLPSHGRIFVPASLPLRPTFEVCAGRHPSRSENTSSFNCSWHCCDRKNRTPAGRYYITVRCRSMFRYVFDFPFFRNLARVASYD
jgi:hypothetical protein